MPDSIFTGYRINALSGGADHQFSGNLSATGNISASNITAPQHYGGSAVNQSLILKSTTGVGTSDYIAFQTGNSSEAMRVDTSGCLLIGATANSGSGYKLQVTGSILNTGAVYVLNANNTNTSLDHFYLVRGTGAGTAGSIFTSGGGSNDVSAIGFKMGTNILAFNTNGTLGLANQPYPWSSTFKTIDIGTYTSLWSSNTGVGTGLGFNTYYNGTSSIAKTTNIAGYYNIDTTGHKWYLAPSQTAGLGQTFTTTMTITTAGNLLIGTSTDTGAKLNVAGNVSASGTITGTTGTLSTSYTTQTYTANQSANSQPDGAMTLFQNSGALDDSFCGNVFYVKNTNTNNQGAYIGAVASPGATSQFSPNLVFGRRSNTAAFSEMARFTPSGDFLFNTTTAYTGVKFLIANTNAGIYRTDTYAQLVIHTNITGATSILNLFSSRTGGANLTSGDFAGAVQAGSYSNSVPKNLSNMVCYIDGTYSAANTAPSGWTWGTTIEGSSSPVERMRLNSVGELMIGTTTATAGSTLLTVGGDSKITGKLLIGTSTSNRTLNINSGSTGTWLQITSTTTGGTSTDGFLIGSDASGNAELVNFENTSMVFKTNNTTAMTINNAQALTLKSGVAVNAFSNDGTLSANSDSNIPTEKAIKTYVGTVGGGGACQTEDIGVATIAQTFGIGRLPHYTIYIHTGTTCTVDRMTFRADTVPGTATVECGIYDNQANNAKLATGTVSVTAAGFWTVNLSTSVTLTAGTIYWFAILNTSTSNDLAFASNNGFKAGTSFTFQGGSGVAALPATEATHNTSNRGIWLMAWKS